MQQDQTTVEQYSKEIGPMAQPVHTEQDTHLNQFYDSIDQLFTKGTAVD